MFWKEKAPISKQIWEHFRLILYFCRFSCYFPIAIERKGLDLFLKWSPSYALYSFALGGFLVIRSIWELYATYMIGGRKTMVKSTTDKITMILSHGGWIVLLFSGVFVMSNKFLRLFAYIKCINQVDSVIRTAYRRSEKYLSIIVMTVAPTLAIAYCGNNFNFFKTVNIDAWGVIEMTGGYYVLYILSVTIFFIIRCIIQSFEKRLQQLNRLLEMENQKIRKMGGLISVGTELKRDVENGTVRTISRSVGIVGEYHGSSLTKLCNAYLKLCNAVDLGNQVFGETITVALVVAFVQVVQPLYFMTVAFGNNTVFNSNIMVSLLAITRNLFCALIVIESAYACNLQVKTTEKLVCRLLCNSISPEYRFQIKTFIICLGLRKIEVSACGIFTVDRFLVTSMIGSAVTLMLLLLQMNDS